MSKDSTKAASELLSANEVRQQFADRPKLLDSWLMVGYRQWLKRGLCQAKKGLKKKLDSLSTAELEALKKRLRG
jgi:hypothetical protein